VIEPTDTADRDDYRAGMYGAEPVIAPAPQQRANHVSVVAQDRDRFPTWQALDAPGTDLARETIDNRATDTFGHVDRPRICVAGKMPLQNPLSFARERYAECAEFTEGCHRATGHGSY